MISRTARPSSPVSRGTESSATHRAKWSISCGKPQFHSLSDIVKNERHPGLPRLVRTATGTSRHRGDDQQDDAHDDCDVSADVMVDLPVEGVARKERGQR